MSAQDRGWTITPTLGWFVVILVAGVSLLDGNVTALADRLTKKRDDQATTPGPVVVAKSEAPTTAEDAEVVAKLPEKPAGSHDIGALDDVCIDGTDASCKRWAMDGFYKAVGDARKGTLGRALRVSWFGDSVVATDVLPGRLRARLQGELGDGGPGFVYVLPPHRFCAHQGITRSGGENFLQYAVSMQHAADGLYGPAGAAVETNSGRATIKVVSGKVTNAELYYLAQPKGGTASISGDGTELASVSTAADAKTAKWLTATTQGASKFEIEGRGKVRLFGISLENGSGAVVDNLGIVSVHVKSYAAADATHWSTQIEHRSADLVLFMIGANEAQWLRPGDHALKEYQGHYEKVLAPIRKARPQSSCLVVSPTDQAEADGDGYKSRAVMPLLIDAQRKAAHAQGCAFYSTYDWMGGKGSAAKWFKKHLLRDDFQHLTIPGATKMADGLFDALMGGAKHAGN
jgi:lysophospholipase L1-like esterase